MLIWINVLHSHCAGATNISQYALLEMFVEDFARRFGMIFQISNLRSPTVVYTLGTICKDSDHPRVLSFSSDEKMFGTGCIDIAQLSHWAWIVWSRRTPFWTLRMWAGPCSPQLSVKCFCMSFFDHYISNKRLNEGQFTNAECDIGIMWHASCPIKLMFLLSLPVTTHTPSLIRTLSTKIDSCDSLAGTAWHSEGVYWLWIGTTRGETTWADFFGRKCYRRIRPRLIYARDQNIKQSEYVYLLMRSSNVREVLHRHFVLCVDSLSSQDSIHLVVENWGRCQDKNTFPY